MTAASYRCMSVRVRVHINLTDFSSRRKRTSLAQLVPYFQKLAQLVPYFQKEMGDGDGAAVDTSVCFSFVLKLMSFPIFRSLF